MGRRAGAEEGRRRRGEGRRRGGWEGRRAGGGNVSNSIASSYTAQRGQEGSDGQVLRLGVVHLI